MSEERWRPVVGYEGLYQISDQGRVRRIGFRAGPLKPWLSSRRYLLVTLSNRKAHSRSIGYLVHRLAAIAFHGDHAGMTVNHIDGVKTNNAAHNLEWLTITDNQRHAIRTGLRAVHGQVTTTCETCGKQIVDWPGRRRIFCSVACHPRDAQGRMEPRQKVGSA